MSESKVAQEYRAAASRVAEMTDDELTEWYAKAAERYTTLALWRRRPERNQGDRTATAFARRDDLAEAAAELFLAIEERLDAELHDHRGLAQGEQARRIYLTATIFR
jgi:hypothetical protein